MTIQMQNQLLSRAVQLKNEIETSSHEHDRLMNEATDKYGFLGQWPQDMTAKIEAIEGRIESLVSEKNGVMSQYEHMKAQDSLAYEYGNE